MLIIHIAFQDKHHEDKIGVLDGPHVRGEGVFCLPTNQQSKATLISKFENSWNKICKEKEYDF